MTFWNRVSVGSPDCPGITPGWCHSVSGSLVMGLSVLLINNIFGWNFRVSLWLCPSWLSVAVIAPTKTNLGRKPKPSNVIPNLVANVWHSGLTYDLLGSGGPTCPALSSPSHIACLIRSGLLLFTPVTVLSDVSLAWLLQPAGGLYWNWSCFLTA